jgi:hypothetical protein
MLSYIHMYLFLVVIYIVLIIRIIFWVLIWDGERWQHTPHYIRRRNSKRHTLTPTHHPPLHHIPRWETLLGTPEHATRHMTTFRHHLWAIRQDIIGYEGMIRQNICAAREPGRRTPPLTSLQQNSKRFQINFTMTMRHAHNGLRNSSLKKP